MGVYALVVGALWAMLPAYVPNNAAVLAGGGRPVDGGRTWRGRRLLGDGKTWRGTVAGVLAGVGVALVLDAGRASAAAALGVPVVGFSLPGAVGLAAGAMAGDLVASFCKRRVGRTRGTPVPVVDQLDFVVGALVCAALLAPAWVARTFTPAAVGVVLVATPLLHVGTNAIAYAFGLKTEPW